MRTVAALLAAASAVIGTVSAMPSVTITPPPKARVVIPLYVLPKLDANGHLTGAYATAAAGGDAVTAIINPNSGESNGCGACDAQNMRNCNDWSAAVALFKAKGVRTIGYCRTGMPGSKKGDRIFGARARSEVERCIDNYVSCWGVDGVFLDEVTPAPEKLSYYKALNKYVHKADPKYEVMINSGFDVPPAMMDACDSAVIYEATYDRLMAHTPADNLAAFDKKRFVMITHSVPAGKWTSAVNRMLCYAGGVYATPDGVSDASDIYHQFSNPYDELPSYWSQEVAHVRAGSESCDRPTVYTGSGPCAWNPSDKNCAVCGAGFAECSQPGCYTKQCRPIGDTCNVPCLNEPGHTQTWEGQPCWWDKSDKSCAKCMPGMSDCGWKGCNKHACVPGGSSCDAIPCNPPVKHPGGSDTVIPPATTTPKHGALGPCAWDPSDKNCAVCGAGFTECSRPGCYTKQCRPTGDACNVPCLNEPGHTQMWEGEPCWWDKSDKSCAKCMPGMCDCGWKGCNKHACVPCGGSCDAIPCNPPVKFPGGSGAVSPITEPKLVGDPFVIDQNGKSVQFFLPQGESRLLLTCQSMELYGRAMGSGIAGNHNQWFDQFRVIVDGTEALLVDVAAANGTSDNTLRTLRMVVDGVKVEKIGAFGTDSGLVAASRVNGVENVQFSSGRSVLNIKSATGNKPGAKTHLDLIFSELKTTDCSAGILAEIWGIVPMTPDTAAMLTPPEM